MAWLTVDMVKAELGLTPADTVDDAWLAQVVDAVMAYAARSVPTMRVPAAVAPPLFPDYAPPDTVLGGLLCASRWYRRRNSPEGLVSFGEMGGVAVPPLDRDIERLWQLGRFSLPKAR